MNKHNMPIEQWLRLQVKSQQVYGTKWQFRKVAERHGINADQIEKVLDQLLDERAKRYAKFFQSGEVRSGETENGTDTGGGDE